MSETYSGLGDALVVNNNCKSLKQFTSSYKWTFPTDAYSAFSVINYQNSFIGKRTLSAVFINDSNSDSTNYWNEISSDGLLNFKAEYYYDSSIDSTFILVTITGVYKKCNYSSREIDLLVSETTSASVKEKLKKGSRSSEDFHKLLNSDQSLNKKYLKLKAKHGK